MLPARGASVRIRPSTSVNAIGTWVWPWSPCSVEIADEAGPGERRRRDVLPDRVARAAVDEREVRFEPAQRAGRPATSRVDSEIAVRVHSIAAWASGLNQSISLAAGGRGVVVAADADGAEGLQAVDDGVRLGPVADDVAEVPDGVDGPTLARTASRASRLLWMSETTRFARRPI